jgi:uncharacterized protein YcaQ
MLKTYELMTRHFGFQRLPAAASEREIGEYLLERALRSQALVSVDSICYLDASRKPVVRRLIEERVRRKELVALVLEGAPRVPLWARPQALETPPDGAHAVHVLSPFDPLVVQRKRLKLFFDYEHRFEAYVPKEKRVFGYFTHPVLAGEEIVALLDLKTDRQRGKLLLQRWIWLTKRGRRERKRQIEEALQRFERFQLAR